MPVLWQAATPVLQTTQGCCPRQRLPSNLRLRTARSTWCWSGSSGMSAGIRGRGDGSGGAIQIVLARSASRSPPASRRVRNTCSGFPPATRRDALRRSAGGTAPSHVLLPGGTQLSGLAAAVPDTLEDPSCSAGPGADEVLAGAACHSYLPSRGDRTTAPQSACGGTSDGGRERRNRTSICYATFHQGWRKRADRLAGFLDVFTS
jgi:hypothetical protein